ncbi:HET-domain-containing protein [Xylariaceae sp. FL0255]|nr:HET-domain-containing protein [Xylariaceae sp. FL0255]
MHLINTTTLKTVEFLEGLQEPYAVLSHRWGSEEISFQDLSRRLQKIENCCRQALHDGFQWAWVDTCWIDKTSSAELSEAINSMFAWYKRSAVCYIFLNDVSETTVNFTRTESSFHRSQWFTRGWTLQELLAPRHARFFNSRWEILGEMTEQSDLCEIVSSITRIPMGYLNGSLPLSQACVAMRMSWASRRITTRVEDIAYCLLGIFDVNMPLLYGEGSKAFLRLQECIIQKTHDSTILVWDCSHDACSVSVALDPVTRYF